MRNPVAPRSSRIPVAVTRSGAQPLEFVGVMAAEGGSNRVEIMVTVRGCHQEPCRLLLNLSRQNQPGLQTELRRKLQASLLAHVPPPATARSVTP
jgi:hypothetical protein